MHTPAALGCGGVAFNREDFCVYLHRCNPCHGTVYTDMNTTHTSGTVRRLAAAAVIAAASLAPATATALTPDEEEAALAAADYIAEMYPEATLRDVYKSFFQDSFGPGHIISGRDEAARQLHEELATIHSDTVAMPPVEAVGFKGQYYRVDLSLIKAGLLSEETLLDAMIQGANPPDTMTPQEWAAQWAEIYNVIRREGFNFPGEKTDAEMIATQLRNGNPVLHHSPAYEHAYHPHYRVVAAPQVEQLILPLLSGLDEGEE